MKHYGHLAIIAILVSLLYLLFPQTAHAYLDPGTGSFIIQMVIAALLGASVTLKIYWSRVKTFFAGHFSRRQSNDD